MSVQSKVTLLLYLMATALAQSTEVTSQGKQTNESSEVSATPWSYYNVAAVGTAVLVVGVGLVALVAFLSPLFLPVMTYRICYALGGCQNTLDSYVDQFIGNELGAARNIRSRNKRGLEYVEPILDALVGSELGTARNAESRNMRAMEYVEPILVTLAKAYENYGDEDVKKNFKTASSFTK